MRCDIGEASSNPILFCHKKVANGPKKKQRSRATRDQQNVISFSCIGNENDGKIDKLKPCLNSKKVDFEHHDPEFRQQKPKYMIITVG